MRKNFVSAVAMLCALGMASGNAAAGNGGPSPVTATTTRAIGVCSPAPNNNYSAENGLAPIAVARGYFQMFEHRTVTGTATVTVLQQPKHGVLRLVTEADRGTLFGSTADPLDPNAGLYAYLPEQGYLGKDAATILADFSGTKVQVKYYFQAVEGPLGSYWDERWCSDTGVRWKISSTLDALIRGQPA